MRRGCGVVNTTSSEPKKKKKTSVALSTHNLQAQKKLGAAQKTFLLWVKRKSHPKTANDRGL